MSTFSKTRLEQVARLAAIYADQGSAAAAIAKALAMSAKTVRNYMGEARRRGLLKRPSAKTAAAARVDAIILAGEAAGHSRREVCAELGWEPTDKNLERVRWRRRKLGLAPMARKPSAKKSRPAPALTRDQVVALREVWPTAQNNAEVALYVFGNANGAALEKLRAAVKSLGLPDLRMERMKVGVARARECRVPSAHSGEPPEAMFGAPIGTKLFRDHPRGDSDRFPRFSLSRPIRHSAGGVADYEGLA